MAKQTKITTEVSLEMSNNQITVSFILEEKDDNERWPKKEPLSIKKIRLKTWFGTYKDIKTISKEIVKIQNNFLEKQKLDGRYYRLLNKICAAYTASLVVEDKKTLEFIEKFTGRIS